MSSVFLYVRMELCVLGDGLCVCFLVVTTAVGDVSHGRGHEDGCQSADDDTEAHCKYEAADAVTAEDEDADKYKQGGCGGHDCTSQGGVDRVVDGVEEVPLGIQPEVLTHTVEYYHGIVDLVANHGQDGGYEGLVYLHGEGEYAPEYGVEADDAKCGESYGCECAKREGNVAEAQQNVQEQGHSRSLQKYRSRFLLF